MTKVVKGFGGRKMNIFLPEVQDIAVSGDNATYADRACMHERLLYQYLKKKVNGWNVKDFLDAEEIHEYALYAVTNFTRIVCDDLRNSREPVTTGWICDRNAQKYHKGYKNWKVIDIQTLVDLYTGGEVKKVIIMSVVHENAIIDSLMSKGIKQEDIISIISLLF